MKRRSALLVFATAAALLAVAPGRAAADPNNASGTWELHVEVPNVAMASNGDTLAITGMGVFSTHPKAVTASGAFTHDVAGGGTATGTWTATDLLSFQFYGCGVVPSIGVTVPPTSCGGALKMRVVFTPAGTSQTSEENPRRKNVFFQPTATTIPAISGAPKARPARVPQLTTPEARPRSLGGNRTLTIFMPPGSYTDSPIPSATRSATITPRVLARPVSPQVNDQSAKHAAYSQRRL